MEPTWHSYLADSRMCKSCPADGRPLHTAPTPSGAKLALEATASLLVRAMHECQHKPSHHYTSLATDCESVANGIGLPALAGGLWCWCACCAVVLACMLCCGTCFPDWCASAWCRDQLHKEGA